MKSMRDYFNTGESFSAFLEKTGESVHPWKEFYNRARVPKELLPRIRSLKGPWRLLVLCEEWCGDGANTLPHLARAVESNPNLAMRILPRDDHPELMDAHLTQGNRSIPVVILLDDEFKEVGWWGPRPGPLQALFLREIRPLPQDQRYPKLRAWYARDRGRTALEEILQLIPVPV